MIDLPLSSWACSPRVKTLCRLLRNSLFRRRWSCCHFVCRQDSQVTGGRLDERDCLGGRHAIAVFAVDFQDALTNIEVRPREWSSLSNAANINFLIDCPESNSDMSIRRCLVDCSSDECHGVNRCFYEHDDAITLIRTRVLHESIGSWFKLSSSPLFYLLYAFI